jgi:hypothetical protein
MNVVSPNPLPPPTERMFENSGVGGIGKNPGNDTSDPDTYEYIVRALIDDAKSFEDSTLAPDREENLQYFYGEKPEIESIDDDGNPTSSTVVSTDVRDTVMAIMPSLIRIFTSPEHIVFCQPNYEGQEDLATQQTDYLEYVFWEDNPGFMLLHDAFKDALTTKTCVLYWYADKSEEIVTQEFQNLSMEEYQVLLSEGAEPTEEPQMAEPGPMNAMQSPEQSIPAPTQGPYAETAGGQPLGGPPTGPEQMPVPPQMIESVTMRWSVNKPIIKIEGVPLDEFRVARDAKTVEDAVLIGFDTTVRKGQLVALGYDEAELDEYIGVTRSFSVDREFRNAGLEETAVLENLEIRYGEYFIRIDKDGDGIEELRKICTVGDNHHILEDYPVQYATFAVGCPDPRSHTLVGDCPADLVKDIQRIKTNMLRGSLDSLAQSIWPRTVFNEMLVSADDVLNDEIGAAIRTKGSPADTVMSLPAEFVGQPVFAMFDAMERLRQQKTGISDASKGLDPKALQSTALSGVDAIISGAQERIELIARLMAETLLKPLFKGLLREITNSPNQERTVQLRGKWAKVNPSTFDANMRISVNPTMGKGSDISRLMALQEVKQTQLMILEKYGLKNPVVGPQELMNTINDMMAIANVKNTSRYFKAMDEATIQQIMAAPDEPAPEMVLAQAEMEKTRAKVSSDIASADQHDKKLRWDDDFRRDQLALTSMLDAAKIEAQFQVDVRGNELEEEAQLNARNEE